MQLSVDQLAPHLKTTLAPLYLLIGTEPLLRKEAEDAIRIAAKEQNIEEREVWQIDSTFDWQQISRLLTHPSLFQMRSLIALRGLKTLTAEGIKTLNDWLTKNALTAAPSKQILCLSCDQLSTATQKLSVFQALSQKAIVIMVKPIVADYFPAWLKTRLHRASLSLTPQAFDQLVSLTEGNLLAASQSIEKLRLIYSVSTEPLSAEAIHIAIEDNAQFELFNLAEAVLQGKSTRTIHILEHLKLTGIAPSLVLWRLLRELRAVAALCYGVAQGQSTAKIFQAHQIWPKRQVSFQRLVKRLNNQDFSELFCLAHQVDKSIKGYAVQDVWEGLQNLSLCMAGMVSKNI